MANEKTEKNEVRRAPMLSTAGNVQVVALGKKRVYGSDLYHFLLKSPWVTLFGLIVTWYLVSNLLFASLYFWIGGVENLPEHDFAHAFFFSVQTIATIGYGHMSPISTAANLLVTVEALYGMLSLAIATSLLFSKFSKPSARVLFSDVAVVTVRDGVPSLLFRMANERGNQILEASLRLSVVRNERTAEGEPVRKVTDLRLTRSQFGVFAMSWLAIHPINEESPLFGWTAEQLREAEAQIVAALIGTDETVMQTIHARHVYSAHEIRWNEKFVDILSTLPDGRRALDFNKFHETVPVTPPEQRPVSLPRAQGERG